MAAGRALKPLPAQLRTSWHSDGSGRLIILATFSAYACTERVSDELLQRNERTACT